MDCGHVETLTPIKLRVNGLFMDLTTERDDQDLLHANVKHLKGERMETTVGRVVFNDALPDVLPYFNGLFKKKGLQQVVQYCYLNHGRELTVEMLDRLKDLGFLYATKSGLSIGIDDLVIPKEKAALVDHAKTEVIRVEKQYLEGAITNGERKNKVIGIWSEVTEKIADEMFDAMEDVAETEDGRFFNSVYIMADSGARGSKQQIRQLAGMRGLMAKPSGEIIETPITSNFREGLDVLPVFHFQRMERGRVWLIPRLKQLIQGTSRGRLVDVAQDVNNSEIDCGTLDGIESKAIC